MSETIVWILFGLGALLCVTNFYLAFLRYPLHRQLGLPKESYHWVSGFPLFGSMCVAISLLGLHDIPAMIPVGTVLMLIDTGGIHWFIGSMIYQLAHQKRYR